jgi:hypothetical protein
MVARNGVQSRGLHLRARESTSDGLHLHSAHRRHRVLALGLSSPGPVTRRSAAPAFGSDARATGLRSLGCEDGSISEFDASDMAILELVAEDSTPFLTLSDVVGATEAQSSVRGLWRRGLVEIARVHEMGAPPDRPVSTLTPDVPSTSRLRRRGVVGRRRGSCD